MTSILLRPLTVAALVLGAAWPALATDAQPRPQAAPAAAAPASAAAAPTAPPTAAADMADGEVRKIDLEAGRITLRHGEIKNLDMPPMTMVFAVKDKALLARVKTGDKVKFRAVQDAGRYTVVDLQATP